MISLQRLVTLVLLGLLVFWIGTTVQSALTDLSSPREPQVAAVDAQLPDLPDLPAPDPLNEDALNDTLDRPLFSASRRPPQAPQEQPASAPSSAGFLNYALTGIIVRAEESVAILRAPDGTIHRLVEGDRLDGWKLAKIGINRATFAMDGREWILAIGE